MLRVSATDRANQYFANVFQCSKRSLLSIVAFVSSSRWIYVYFVGLKLNLTPPGYICSLQVFLEAFTNEAEFSPAAQEQQFLDTFPNEAANFALPRSCKLKLVGYVYLVIPFIFYS